MKDITGELDAYRARIERFLAVLNNEKKYFNLDLKRILNYDLVIVAQAGDEITAIAGIEKKLGIPRNIILVREQYQGRGLGKQYLGELLTRAAQKYSLVMAVIKEDNIASLKLHKAIGYSPLGRRQTLWYLVMPFSKTGRCIAIVLKAAFPFMKIVDLIRR